MNLIYRLVFSLNLLFYKVSDRLRSVNFHVVRNMMVVERVIWCDDSHDAGDVLFDHFH